MGLDVPVSVDVARVVLLDAGHLDLLESPLRQVDSASTEVAAKIGVLQPEGGGQGAQLGVITRCGIIDNFDSPVVLGIANGGVSVRRHLPVSLGDRGLDRVRVQVATGLGVNKADDISIADEAEGIFKIVLGLMTVWVEEPLVVGILVVVAGDLLLAGAFGVRLNVRVEETAAVSHVLECGPRAKSHLERAVFANFSAPQVGLEERAHLRISRTAVLENEEVEVKREEVDDDRNDDETEDAESDVRGECRLWRPLSARPSFTVLQIQHTTYLCDSEVTKLVPEVLNRVDTNKRSAEHTDPLDTANATNRQTSHHQPEAPLGREGLLLLTVELRPAENSGEGEEEQHRVEQDESANGCVRVLKQNHQGDEPHCRLAKVQRLCSVIGQGYAESAKGRVELAHERVVELFRIRLARLEFKGAVVAREPAREPNKHLAQRRVNIKVEFTLEVMRSEFAKTGV